MHADVLHVVPHELRDLWRTVDVRQQLEIDVEFSDGLGDVIELVGKTDVLVGHGAHGDALVIVMQGPRQGILDYFQARNAILLGEAPDLAPEDHRGAREVVPREDGGRRGVDLAREEGEVAGGCPAPPSMCRAYTSRRRCCVARSRASVVMYA